MNAENFTIFALWANLSGAVANIGLNFFMIPYFGAFGAAYATLISYFLVYIDINAIHPKSRELFKAQINAMFLRGVVKWIRTRI